MTPDQRAHLRALAERVRTEEPTEGLRDAVLIAFGWRWCDYLDGMISPRRDYWLHPPNPLTSRDASAEAMPEGWTVLRIEQDIASWAVAIVKRGDPAVVRAASAPTEPRARTAAALLAMAAEGDGP